MSEQTTGGTPVVASPVRRGTTNGNARGGSDERRRRREWLVATYRADLDVQRIYGEVNPFGLPTMKGLGEPACRCYRCGVLLTAETVTVDRIIPGCQGGTYRRTNIRPSCQPCASLTGAVLGNDRKRALARASAQTRGKR